MNLIKFLKYILVRERLPESKNLLMVYLLQEITDQT